MISRSLFTCAKQLSLFYYEKAGIHLTDTEKANIEIADFGLNDLMNTGLQLIVYTNTARVCAKEMVLFPYQLCPEHKHPAINNEAGKEETFRCRYGTVYLYVEGERNIDPSRKLPKGVFTVFHEIILNAGEQYTIFPDTLHWFQAGSNGAVISEFSTTSRDESDIFTDPRIIRIPIYEET